MGLNEARISSSPSDFAPCSTRFWFSTLYVYLHCCHYYIYIYIYANVLFVEVDIGELAVDGKLAVDIGSTCIDLDREHRSNRLTVPNSSPNKHQTGYLGCRIAASTRHHSAVKKAPTPNWTGVF
jgi:hypothetical protein